MNTKRLSDLLNVTTNTVRRWCDTYEDFLSPTATPAKGQTRVLSELDQRVLLYVSALRDTGETPDDIRDRLNELQANHWQNLPGLPAGWSEPENLMPVTVAAAKARELAEVAVLQRELTHVRAELERVTEGRERLREDLASERGARADLQDKLHASEVQIATLEGQVATLEARLESFHSLTGGRPLILILGVTVLLTAILIAGAFWLSALLP